MSAMTCEAMTTVAERLGDAVHQQLQELPADERVEARERLVEEQQARPLPEHERQGELRALADRKGADLRARIESRQQAATISDPSADSSAVRTPSSRRW